MLEGFLHIFVQISNIQLYFVNCICHVELIQGLIASGLKCKVFFTRDVCICGCTVVDPGGGARVACPFPAL